MDANCAHFASALAHSNELNDLTQESADKNAPSLKQQKCKQT
jgi:uncharacterized protein YdcH (DUF465 family)